MDAVKMNEVVQRRDEFARFIMAYKFALDEILTKINILKQEFQHVHDYNPIEHVTSRLKSPKSIIEKLQRINCPLDVNEIRARVFDIAGVRITCSFINDVHQIFDMISRQRDVEVLEVKDYISQPKESGYRSLHMIVRTPVHMSDRIEEVTVEIQIRTIAMDFWASLEHKIYYKYNDQIPKELLDQLKGAAVAARELDERMQNLHVEVSKLKLEARDDEFQPEGGTRLPLAADILSAFLPAYAEVSSPET